MFTQLLKKIQHNWRSGITVALVSLPLSISLAIASQATPVAGIITAIWAGLIASLFGGSNYNIIGPTGALSGILATYALNHGAQALPALALITGICILLAWLLKLERYIIFVPSSTIHGFTLGVAFIIALNQLNFALGLKSLAPHDTILANTYESLRHLTTMSWPTFMLFLSALLALHLFANIKIPGAIIVAFIGIGIGYLSHIEILPYAFETLGTKFGTIHAQLFAWPTFHLHQPLVGTGIIVAIIAIVETMISARIADGITHTKHPKRKELFGLGLANIASGLCGGIPATAALARTALNIKSGATDKLSQTISSICMAIIALLFLTFFTYLPLAVVAALLVMVAIRMIEAEHFFRLFHHDKTNFFIALLVAVITVYEDPIIGIFIGTAISLFIFMEQISHGHFNAITAERQSTTQALDTPHQIPTNVFIYAIKGQLAYINSQAHCARFESNFPDYTYIVLDLRELYFIDMDGIDAIDEIADLITAHKSQLYIIDAPLMITAQICTQSKHYKQLKTNHHIFTDLETTLQTLKTHS